jgi:serine/threonine-protein kinase
MGAGNSSRRTLTWIDRRGREQTIAAPARAYVWARISPDGSRVALDARDQDQDIWMLDLARQTLTRVTFDPGVDGFPNWTPDGRQILFESNRGGSVFNVFRQSADNTGNAEQLTRSANPVWPFSISPDGTKAIVQEVAPGTRRDLGLLILDGRSAPQPLIQTPFSEQNGEISPDGRWVAYQSDESGVDQVYVRPFPDVNGGHWQVSLDGGRMPAWSPGGRELFYLSGTAMMAVPIQLTSTFRADNPTKLFEVPPGPPLPVRSWDVSRDGQRFLMIKDPPASDGATMPTTIVMVLNWTEELKRLVPAR